MTCWSTNESWDTTLALLLMTGWFVVSGWMLGSILSVSVDPHEKSWAETALALAPLCGDLKPEELLRQFSSDVGPQEVKFVLNPVLPFCYFLGSLARLVLGESTIASSSEPVKQMFVICIFLAWFGTEMCWLLLPS